LQRENPDKFAVLLRALGDCIGEEPA
jgi:hypothetical protein